MKSAIALAITTCLMSTVAPEALAQVTTRPAEIGTHRQVCAMPGKVLATPQPVCTCTAAAAGEQSLCDRASDQLTRLIDHGTTEALDAYLERLVLAIENKVPQKSIVRFVWSATASDGKPVVRSVIRAPKEDENIKAGVLPGLEGATANYYDVLVGFDARQTTPPAELPFLDSLYTSTQVDNPLLEQVPAFIKRLNILEAIGAAAGVTTSPLIGTMNTMRRITEMPEQPSPVPATTFRIYQPTFTDKRAIIAIEDRIISPRTIKSFSSGAGILEAALRDGVGRSSTCAVNLAASYESALTASAACVGGTATSPFAFEATSCRADLLKQLDEAYTTVRNNAALCPADTNSVGVDPVAVVDGEFRRYARSLGGSLVEGEVKLKNAPHEDWSFGVLTAVRVGEPSFDGPRTKISSGLVDIDPLPRLISAVIVNWHPIGHPRWKGFRLSSGMTVSPDPGIILAVGYSPLKGFTVTGGSAWLWANSPRTEVTIGSKPPEEFLDDPFIAKRIRTWILGFSYSF